MQIPYLEIRFQNLIEYHDAALFWYNETLKISKEETKYAEFNSTIISEKDKVLEVTKNLSFLEGIMGIGLSLILSISSIEPRWDDVYY